MSIIFMTSRFNDYTWEQNYQYRLKLQWKGCLYGSPTPLEISPKNSICMIEMNNSQNKIMGIGYFNNIKITDKLFNVYDTYNWNRYTYWGNYWISRETLKGYDLELVELLDKILFKGRNHQKRGKGLTKITETYLINEIVGNLIELIKNVLYEEFKCRNIETNKIIEEDK